MVARSAGVVGGIGFGLLGDVVVGVAGAVIGGWIFGTLQIRQPLGGLPGTVLVAFVGAIVLLVLIRTINGRRSKEYALAERPGPREVTAANELASRVGRALQVRNVPIAGCVSSNRFVPSLFPASCLLPPRYPCAPSATLRS